MFTEQTGNLIFVGAILAGIIIACAAVIVRRFVMKKMITAGSQYVGQNIYLQYQNADRKRAVEEVIYQNDGEKQHAFSGEDEGEDT
jgi:hypothetical protein